MLAVGSKAPEFTLLDQNGDRHSLQDYKGKKVILLNSSIHTFLNNKDWLMKIENIIEYILTDKEVVLIWRPHPLLLTTIKSMRSNYLEQYENLLNKINESENGIVDCNEDCTDAFLVSDGMISDYSSLILQYTFTEKPTLLLTGTKDNCKHNVFCDYFYNLYRQKNGQSLAEHMNGGYL